MHTHHLNGGSKKPQDSRKRNETIEISVECVGCYFPQQPLIIQETKNGVCVCVHEQQDIKPFICKAHQNPVRRTNAAVPPCYRCTGNKIKTMTTRVAGPVSLCIVSRFSLRKPPHPGYTHVVDQSRVCEHRPPLSENRPPA